MSREILCRQNQKSEKISNKRSSRWGHNSVQNLPKKESRTATDLRHRPVFDLAMNAQVFATSWVCVHTHPASLAPTFVNPDWRRLEMVVDHPCFYAQINLHKGIAVDWIWLFDCHS